MTRPALAAALAALLAGPALAEDDMIAQGRAEYMVSCANCHGEEARGDGPFAEVLTLTPSDLTSLAARNDGTFPEDRVYRIVDGRLPVEGHGTAEMPIWGEIYLDDARTLHRRRYGPGEAENYVTERILSLIAYLRSVQAE